MLRLDKSKDNIIAIYLNSTGSFPQLFLEYSQDYDLSSGSMFMDVDSTKGQYRVGTIASSYVPDYSGLYTIDIFEATQDTYIWDEVAIQWDALAVDWMDAGSGKIGDSLRTIRGIVSGSNNPDSTTYLSPNELGKYTTYNG